MLPLREDALQPGQWRRQMVCSVSIRQPSEHAFFRVSLWESFTHLWILKEEERRGDLLSALTGEGISDEPRFYFAYFAGSQLVFQDGHRFCCHCDSIRVVCAALPQCKA